MDTEQIHRHADGSIDFDFYRIPQAGRHPARSGDEGPLQAQGHGQVHPDHHRRCRRFCGRRPISLLTPAMRRMFKLITALKVALIIVAAVGAVMIAR
jgi:hypothetical protein